MILFFDGNENDVFVVGGIEGAMNETLSIS